MRCYQNKYRYNPGYNVACSVRLRLMIEETLDIKIGPNLFSDTVMLISFDNPSLLSSFRDLKFVRGLSIMSGFPLRFLHIEHNDTDHRQKVITKVVKILWFPVLEIYIG